VSLLQIDRPGRGISTRSSRTWVDWKSSRKKFSLEWERAKHASRDAWTRVKNAAERAMPGDADRDGR
jgi:hypothetical protein